MKVFYSLVLIVSLSISSHLANSYPLDALKLQHEDINFFSSTTLERVGHGRNNVLQGIAIDIKHNYLYTTHPYSHKKKAVINRFDLLTTKTVKATSSQKPVTFLGHQGITIDPETGMLWGTAGSSIAEPGRHIVGFRYKANKIPTHISVVKVFGKGYSSKAYTMPSFSPNGKYMLVRGHKKHKDYIRVFDMQKIKLKDKSDISTSYTYEWKISKNLKKNKYAFQAMTTDGRYVYLLSGGIGKQNPKNKRLFVYTIQGKLLQEINQITVGKKYLEKGKEGHWEPEGIAINDKTKRLLLLFAIGDRGTRKAIIYYIPIEPTK